VSGSAAERLGETVAVGHGYGHGWMP